jgi:hypothetical protein
MIYKFFSADRPYKCGVSVRSFRDCLRLHHQEMMWRVLRNCSTGHDRRNFTFINGLPHCISVAFNTNFCWWPTSYTSNKPRALCLGVLNDCWFRKVCFQTIFIHKALVRPTLEWVPYFVGMFVVFETSGKWTCHSDPRCVLYLVWTGQGVS